MLSMTRSRVSWKDSHDDLRFESTHRPDRVLFEDFPRPALEGLLQRTCVAEVVGTGEILPGSLEPPGCQKLTRADQTQSDSKLGPDQILSTLASGQRQVGRFAAHSPTHQRENRGVLVVRMRTHHHHSAMSRQLGKRPIDGLDATC